MNKTLITSLLATSLASSAALGQSLLSPPIEWQQSFGGTNTEELTCLQQTTDGGYILAGSSRSAASGNKSSPLIGFQDGWVVRLDASGNRLWDQSFGGPRGDGLTSLQQLRDGGFILGGFYGSPVGLGTNAGTSIHSQPDFWVVRLDVQGNRLWERVYGGSSGDILYEVKQTIDGGFILCGYSYSPADGSKSAPNFGNTDGWVVRLDAEGNKLWDRSFGGAGHDTFVSVLQTTDGGFILGGSTVSGVGGNNISGGMVSDDFWVVRLDAQGNKLWDRTYGSTNSESLTCLAPTTDGGLVLGGEYTFEVTNRIGNRDQLVIRLDAAGEPIWTTHFGGTSTEFLHSLQQTADGGFIVAGASYSGIGGSKTTPSFGDPDCWVVRLDPNGNKLWEQSYGGVFWEVGQCVRTTADGGYVLGITSGSPPSGNKTSPLFGAWDFWVVKLGCELPDSDGDGVADAFDVCPGTSPAATVDEHGCSADQRDSDGDGVADADDLCAETPPGSVVNATGCSIAQLCPCEGPWRNHGEYLQAVKHAAAQFLQAGLITEPQHRQLLIQAAQSPCGK